MNMESSTISKTQYVNRDELVNAILDSCASSPASLLLSEAINEWYCNRVDKNAVSFICRYMNENGNPVSDEEKFMPYARILSALDSLSAIEVVKTINVTFKEIKS